MSLHVHECRACGHRVYPARLWCPACGHDGAQAVAVNEGEVLAWTTQPSAKEGADTDVAIIGTARTLPDGPVLVLRLQDSPTHIGQRLRLFERTVAGRALPWGAL